ncbi:MAG: hypothetical protein HOE90_00020 [Bacteriovoracaceae bacterium]|nr:hypothetical protein [Bacteriovoracaceae bacterium]
MERIRSLAKGDADKNAIVILNTLAQMMNIELRSNLETIRPFFKDRSK